MTLVIYDGDADLRHGTAHIERGVPIEVEDAEVQPLIERYGFRLAVQKLDNIEDAMMTSVHPRKKGKG